MQGFSPDDLYFHRKLTELHAVPAADAAVGTVRSVDRENNQYVSCLWEFPTDGRPPRQLTRGPGLDKSPRWSPDAARIAFLSTRAGGASQVHLMDMKAGEARQVGHFEMGAQSVRWSPDGKQLFATAAVPSPSRPDDDVEVAWRLPYKSDGIGYVLGREIHLFRIDPATGESTQLTQGAIDVNGFEVSPNGKHVAHVRTREGRYAHRTDLWVCDPDGGHARQLTHMHALTMQPSWSPDGRWIAFAGALREGDSELRLWLLEFATGQVQPLGPEGVEVAAGEDMCWDADSARLVFTRAHRGRHEVVAVTVPQGRLEVLVTGERQFSAFGRGAKHFFYAVDTPVQPSEMHCCQADGSGERRLGELNAWWHERTPLVMQSREFNVPDGLGGRETIHGWLLHAQGAQGPMPLLNDVHGGPASYALLDYDTNVYWQVLCSRGWAVLMLNAVGSSSYGGEFCSRLSGNWGEYDLPQHRTALGTLQREGVCDDRIAIAGKSYGGYFASWTIRHCDDFRAAVVMAPVGNIETHYGTSDGGYYADPLYIDTAPTFDRQRARELSPLQFVERANTPTLFMQGKEDERCPKCQSEEMFVSLYRAGDTPAELVLYPDEGHLFLGEGKPKVRVDAAKRIVEWVVRHAGRPAQARREIDESGEEKQPDESTAG